MMVPWQVDVMFALLVVATFVYGFHSLITWRSDRSSWCISCQESIHYFCRGRGKGCSCPCASPVSI